MRFFGLGFILCKAVQKKYFVLKYFREVQVVAIRNKPFNDQLNVVDFYLWNLQPLHNPKSAEI